MSDILAMRGISVCHPKILFRKQFRGRRAHEISPICMHDSLAHETFNVSCELHNNILGYRKFSHNILCKNLWYLLECFERVLQLIQWEKITILYNFVV